MRLRTEQDFPPAFKEFEVSPEGPQIAPSLSRCPHASDGDGRRKQSRRLLPSASHPMEEAHFSPVMRLHKHPLRPVQGRITSMLLLWHTGIAVRTATEIKPFFLPAVQLHWKLLGLLSLGDRRQVVIPYPTLFLMWWRQKKAPKLFFCYSVNINIQILQKNMKKS